MVVARLCFAYRKYHSTLGIVLIVATVIGILLFAKGFLHVRRLVEDRSECGSLPVMPLFSTAGPLEDFCWLPVKRRRFVIVVIDALRIDFALPSKPGIEKDAAWFDKLQILYELVQNGSAKLFHFVADPPTATTQRLSSIAAGSLPAFVEMAANFAESSLGADSLVHQLLQTERHSRLDMYGDDTWLSLFPIIKEQSKGKIAGYHSFHLFDLHTVDNGIKEHIFPALDKNEFDVIIAHFLGFDHCGHKFGPKMPACGEKLGEMDQVLRRIIDGLKDDTTLIVLGDHGMTDNGDHGGISSKEVGSVLFTYGKGSGVEQDSLFWRAFNTRAETARRDLLNLDGTFFFDESNEKAVLSGSVSQIDFTPTFALLAGISIPYGNVGTIIPEILVDHGLYSTMQDARSRNLKKLVDAARINSYQIARFLKRCQDLGESNFDPSSLAPLDKKLQYAELLVAKKEAMSEEELEEAFFAFYDFLLSSQKYCRRIWADFDLKLIYGGLALAIVSVVAMLIPIIWNSISFSSIFAIALSSFHTLALGSVAYVTFEDSVVRFLLSSVIAQDALVSFFEGSMNRKRFSRTLTALLLVRLTSYTGACREEQFPFCQVIVHRSQPWQLSVEVLLSLSMGIVGLFWIFKRCHASLGEARESIVSLVGHFLYFGILTLLGTHWVWTWISETRDLEGGAPERELDQMMEIIVPRALFILCATAAILFRKSSALFFVAVAALVGTVLRPFGGWVLVVAGFALLRLGIPLFAGRPSPVVALFYYLAGMHLFFISGHQATITNLQWEAAFIGFRSTIQAVAGTLMGLNTFGGPALAAIAISIHAEKKPKNAMDTYSAYIWFHLAPLVSSAVSSAVLLRHLMLWKMFTPRFMMQALSCVVCFTVIFLMHISQKNSGDRSKQPA
ncbi:hypothetical protein PSACC_03467 [Paramicrosporidium saccamoebae]|uniref:Uncharacterized protein n=1 Tax=Paramicrosporidium saccamoebae TaxID=1246581 RepID=A0A2H9TG00_9FUNG|nr:hypothetical protein PSACC_03467 [Paramicrosporidium saccamoebae]